MPPSVLPSIVGKRILMEPRNFNQDWPSKTSGAVPISGGGRDVVTKSLSSGVQPTVTYPFKPDWTQKIWKSTVMSKAGKDELQRRHPSANVVKGLGPHPHKTPPSVITSIVGKRILMEPRIPAQDRPQKTWEDVRFTKAVQEILSTKPPSAFPPTKPLSEAGKGEVTRRPRPANKLCLGKPVSKAVERPPSVLPHVVGKPVTMYHRERTSNLTGLNSALTPTPPRHKRKNTTIRRVVHLAPFR
ncbi:hypothetical protein UPYG_G00240370 [Umbra pygmaea]|uniref:Testicular haploid expressed protein n=1 Tax=Umbra pygmaea TaxID=75934 RepID=A0ABD0X5N8_UMBPY